MRPLRFAAACLPALIFGNVCAEAAWFCEPLQAYYPQVRSCPIPWRSVDPRSGTEPLTIPPAPNALDSAAPARMRPTRTSQTQSPQTEDEQGSQPTFPAPSSFVRGDVLDQWCKGSTTALLTAICGDDKLRDLAVQRLYAFEEAKGRLTPDQQKTLIADQNKWAMSYPQTCGLNADVQPSLPLAPQLQDCLEKAGRARLQYLKDYGLPDAEKAAASPEAAAPAPPAPATPPPPTPSTATLAPASATAPAETQSPPTTNASSTPAAAPQDKPAQPPAKPTASPASNEAHQSATATIPPDATPAKPAPHPHSSLAAIANFTRTGATLIAVIVLAIWAIAAWLRSRRTARASETPEQGQ